MKSARAPCKRIARRQFNQCFLNLKPVNLEPGHCLEDAAGRQLVSDVPLCAMLSGGLDNSILSALAGAEYRKRGKTLHTWSVDYADNSRYFHAGRFVPSEDAHSAPDFFGVMTTAAGKILKPLPPKALGRYKFMSG